MTFEPRVLTLRNETIWSGFLLYLTVPSGEPYKPLLFVLGLTISLIFLICGLNKRINIVTVTLILLGVAAIALIWVYRITRKPRQKHP